MDKSHEYGYARVSSKDQNLARQMDALAGVGLDESHIYTDKASGKDFQRPAYKRMLRKRSCPECWCRGRFSQDMRNGHRLES